MTTPSRGTMKAEYDFSLGRRERAHYRQPASPDLRRRGRMRLSIRSKFGGRNPLSPRSAAPARRSQDGRRPRPGMSGGLEPRHTVRAASHYVADCRRGRRPRDDDSLTACQMRRHGGSHAE
jgi:hypothetical protein